MIQLNRAELRDKIYACWLGKNIGGTLGTPFEGKQQCQDISGFNSPPGNPLPNDDLDLQLVWLKALMENGPQKLNEHILGEYWLEYISPYWNEYGVGKGNMARGLVPPLSGEYNNSMWKNSNGAWIRTEVWACLNPCLIDETMRFGYMDACVDHGLSEGTYATIFVAALESAAFIVSDIKRLIEIGLSNIPEDCRTHRFIQMAVDAYETGKTWKEAREEVTQASLADPELGWFQAPANVAYAIIGLLYGEGDFKKTLILAVNCGDDTDCTAATAGAVLGIMHGTKIIPEDWQEYIGDNIVTVAINRGEMPTVPKSCTELTDTILSMHPVMLTGKAVRSVETATEFSREDTEKFYATAFKAELAKRAPYSFVMSFPLTTVQVAYDRAPEIQPGGEIGITVTVKNNFRSPKHLNLRFILPEGWSVSGGTKNMVIVDRYQKREGTSASFILTAGETVQAKNRVILEISCEGHPDVALIPMTFLG